MPGPDPITAKTARRALDVTEIEPFPVSIPEHDLGDLRERLDRVRLPEAETVQDGTQGIGLKRLRSLPNLPCPAVGEGTRSTVVRGFPAAAGLTRQLKPRPH
jgi:hypothetical protein